MAKYIIYNCRLIGSRVYDRSNDAIFNDVEFQGIIELFDAQYLRNDKR